MKILDLLSEAPIQTSVKNVAAKSNLADYDLRNNLDHSIPHGAFSMVKPDKDPHMVKKTSTSANLRTEGFKLFIEYLLKHDLMDTNIHFPRVYNVKTIKGKDDWHIDSFTVEKLLSWKEIPKEQLIEYFYRCTGHKFPTINIDSMDDFAKLITDSIILGKFIFKLDTLNQACKVLHTIYKENYPEAWVDTHFNNMMYRTGPYGIQLVFSDPITN